MSTTTEYNKRIAKNTIFLYFRMLLTMAVSLYTSRVILQTLGVEDYGIYNVVGGIVTMFVFINSSMVSSTQRYITYAIGKGDFDLLKRTFTTFFPVENSSFSRFCKWVYPWTSTRQASLVRL